MRQALSCWIVAGVAASAVGACSGRPRVAPPAAPAPAPAPVVAPGPPAERTTASGVRVWTVGRNAFWIDVPVALPPPDSPGAMALTTDGTADALFPAVPDAASVRVTVSVSHSTVDDIAAGRALRDVAAKARPPNSTFAQSAPDPVTPTQVAVPGAADAYLIVAEFESNRVPGEKAVSLVLHAVPQAGRGPWLVRANAIGPEQHELLARDGPLVELLEELVRSFSLKERPVARLPVTPPAAPAPQIPPVTIDASGRNATGAPTEREAVRLAGKAMVEGDPEAWARVVVYGRNGTFPKAYDESQLATMRLGRAVRSRPVPGISSWDVSRALESLQRMEQMLREIDRLPRPPREGERADEGATGGPTRLIERGGRFYLERYVPGAASEAAEATAGDAPVGPFTRSFRASAAAYNEAAAKHLAGEFGDVREIETFIRKRRDELMPPESTESESDK